MTADAATLRAFAEDRARQLRARAEYDWHPSATGHAWAYHARCPHCRELRKR